MYLVKDESRHVAERRDRVIAKLAMSVIVQCSPSFLRPLYLFVGPIGYRPLPPTYHTSLERGQHQGSSGDDKGNDKDTHKAKYKDKDKGKTFKKKVKVLCLAINIYRQTGS